MSFASYKSHTSKKNEEKHIKNLKKTLGGMSDEDEDEEEEDEDEVEDEDEAEDEDEDEDVIGVGLSGESKKKNIDDEDINSIEDDENSVNSEYDTEDDEKSIGSVEDTNIQKLLGENQSDDDEDEEEDDEYLQKFEENLKKNVISEYHSEMLVHNYDEIDVLSRIIRNEDGVIIDPLHKMLPFITKYEKARIIGERARQIDSGAKPFVSIDPDVIDGYLIALKEYEAKKIPFILKRPLPSGRCEYWKFCDIEILH